MTMVLDANFLKNDLDLHIGVANLIVMRKYSVDDDLSWWSWILY